LNASGKVVCCLAFWACVGCESEIGSGPTGHSIRGSLIYGGTRAKDFQQPASIVMANTELSTTGTSATPYALASSTSPDFTKPLPYELRLLLPGRYFVLAIIADIANFDATGSPMGAYPNACTLVQMPAERSVQMQDKDLENIDIRVFDALADDPCFSQPRAEDAGPQGDSSGSRGEFDARVTASNLSVAPGDRISVALFAGTPGVNDPSYIQVVTDPVFPITVRVEGVASGDYTVVVCFQKANSQSSTCMGPDDRFAFYPSLSGRVSVDAAQTTTVDLDLSR
jgi:hypothetical protein